MYKFNSSSSEHNVAVQTETDW